MATYKRKYSKNTFHLNICSPFTGLKERVLASFSKIPNFYQKTREIILRPELQKEQKLFYRKVSDLMNESTTRVCIKICS